MIKTYILDTNVLLQDCRSIFKFEDNNIVIPIGVLEELDKFKKDMSELGGNARHVVRTLDDLRSTGDIRQGVKIGDGQLRIECNGKLLDKNSSKTIDAQVLDIAENLTKEKSNEQIVLVTQDINLRVRAGFRGIEAQRYRGNVVAMNDDVDVGHEDIELSASDFDQLAELGAIDLNPSYFKSEHGIYPNKFLHIQKKGATKKKDRESMMGYVSANKDLIMRSDWVIPPELKHVNPMNKEQFYLMDALFNPQIQLICIAGRAGTGKTLLSIASGFNQVESHLYKRLLISRPTVPMGRDLGFLPGDMNEKMDPWLSPIYDAFDVINNKKGGGNSQHSRSWIEHRNDIMVEPLTYIRGRSIHEQFMVVDEAQNLAPLEAKTIITRAGQNTKIIMTGDIYQIDNPYVDIASNGLSTVMNSMKNSHLSAHIVMSRGVRSELAEEASKLL